ncbi:MAG: M16 family metallopeptidase [Bacteroidia bacterium]
MHSLDRTHAPEVPAYADFELVKAKAHQIAHHIPAFTLSAGEQAVLRIDFIIGSGSWDEEVRMASSMTNRMLQEGSRHRSGRDLAESLDKYGAYVQYEAGADRSGLSLYTLSKHLAEVLPTVLELLFMPGFPLAELETTVRNNIQQIEVEGQKVSVMARRALMQAMFGAGHPYGYQVQADDLRQLRPDQLARFHKRHYTTDNLMVIVAGLAAEEALVQIDKALAGLTPCFADKPERSHGLLGYEAGRLDVPKAGALQHALRLGKPVVGKQHLDYPGLKVLNTVLGGYFGSRLMSNLREDKGYTYGIGSAILSYERAAFFTLATEVAADVSDLALSEIHRELQRLRTELIPAVELDTVRAYLQGVYLSNFDGAFALADRFRDIYFFGLDYDYYDRYIGTVQNISSEQLLELAQQYLDPDSLISVRAGT